MKTIVATVMASAMALMAADMKMVGRWRVAFDEATGVLLLDNDVRQVTLEGKVGFASEGKEWRVAASRDAVADRLAVVDPAGTVRAYVSFQGDGDTLSFTVFHRAGYGNEFPGRLRYDARVRVRAESFPCRTFPVRGEQVISFADGAGDSALNDSIFAREEDLAVRFASAATRIATAGAGAYDVHLEADVDEPALATATVTVDAAYYASRWAPGYHPIDRKRCPRAPTGWMSWNTYFDKAGAKENLAEARVGAKYLKPFGLEIWSIESWQGNSEWLPTSAFANLDLSRYERQFPYPMKQFADELRALGFRPGLWMPLYGTGDEKFHDAHRDWFLHDKDGQPIGNWNGRYMLDTTNPEVLDLMRMLTRTASRDWGYEFFKFDGMANTPRKFERPEIRARMKDPADRRWFERSVRALREGIGEDRLLLGCMGDYTGTEAQFLDASRLGADVVGCYRGLGETYAYGGDVEKMSDFCQMPVKWANILHQARSTLAQVFVNNIMFYTDPDTLLVGYMLERHEAEVMATIIGLPGQLMFAGDKLGTLRMDRMKILQQVLPVADVHPQNLYPFAATSMLPVWNLAVTRPFGRWNAVALFNFTDAPKDFSVPLASLGLAADGAYEAYEFWGQQYCGTFTNALEAAAVPMRSVKLYAIRPAARHPQFVGDDRHITQGAVELNDLAWDAAAKTYTVDVKVVGTFPLTFAVKAPAGFDFKKVGVPPGVTGRTKREGSLLRVTLTAPETRDAKVVIQF